jgi:hypothetical protein
MAEPTAQQLARQRLANTDIAMFAPLKQKKSEPETQKFTKPAVMLSAEEKKERQKDYSRAWYERHKDYCRERSKQWAAEHRDKARQFSRNYYHAHKEERNEASKKWRDEHKDIYNARMREYRRKQREKRSDGTRI